MNNREMALSAAAVLDEKKALDVVIIDIGAKSSFADYFVIASGASERQVGTLAEEVEERFAKEGVHAKSIEGKQNSGWILMDFGDVIVNLFSVSQREHYNIEKIWSDCPFIDPEREANQED